MNIHITDINEFEKLKAATLETIKIGSVMYGTNNENSDIDLLHIYVPSITERLSFTSSHHQIQYKENGVDHIFINIYSFIRNCLNGDSPLNFECIFSNDMKNSNTLGFLYKRRDSFRNYKVVKSYLGMAERDIKQISVKKTNADKNKKLAHACRCYYFAVNILDNNFTPYIGGKLKNLIETIRNIKQSARNVSVRNEFLEIVKNDIIQLRKDINLDINKSILTPYMKASDQLMLDIELSNLAASDIWKQKENWYMDMSKIYLVQENDNIIKYESNS